MADTNTYYTPGLRFKSGPRAFGHQEFCRSESKKYAADGTVIEITPALVAEFAKVGDEYTVELPNGEMFTAATRWGGVFDLDEQAEAKGWTDEEKEVVARHMLRRVARNDENFTLLSKPLIAPPWSTYDTTHHAKIANLAEATGAVAEALAYEKENKKRQSVIDDLERLLAAGKVDEEFVAV